MMISFDMSTLSPALMSVTFLAMALKNILFLDSQSPVQDLFKTGFYLGIATLFYLPTFIFLPASILCFSLFRTSSVRSLLNILAGFILCILILLLYFAYKGNVVEFYRYFIQSIVLSKTWIYNVNQLLILFTFPTIMLFLSIIKLKSARGFINYQQNSHWLIIIWTIFTLAAMLISPKISSVSFVIFAPLFAFFFSQFLLLQKKKLIVEIQLLVTIGILLGTSFYLYQSINKDNDFYAGITVNKKSFESKKQLMVLGGNNDAYYENAIASPFLNWKISSNYLDQLNRYSVINYVKKSILEDEPELIVDYSKEKISNTIFEQIPLLLDYYQLTGDSTVIVYEKKRNSKKAQTSAIN
jgi:hypothetical protein